MSWYVLQVTLILILGFLNCEAKKPPGYVAPPKEYDPNPPNYEYGYRIQEEKATHGKDEQRDGIYAQGRYYVEKGTESSQNVKYFADEWGYHPVVEYSNQGPYSKSSTNFVLGEEAIKLKNNQKSIPQDPSDPGKAENLAKQSQPQPTAQPNDQEYVLQGDTSAPAQLYSTDNELANPTVSQPLFGEQEDPSRKEDAPGFTTSSQTISNQLSNVDQTQPDLNKLDDPGKILTEDVTQQPEGVAQEPLQLQEDPLPQNPLPEIQNNLNEPTETPIEIEPRSQLKEVILEANLQYQKQPHPLIYYIQQQSNDYDLKSALIPQLGSSSYQQQLYIQPAVAQNQIIYQEPSYKPLVEQVVYSHQVLHAQNKEEQNGAVENLPEPQALIASGINENSFIENNQSDQLIQHQSHDAKTEIDQALETAALVKIPNEIVEGSIDHKEFGVKPSPKARNGANTRNLIESTRNLISGLDVLNINAAISQSYSSGDEIETGTVHSLLHQYVTPTIVNNHVNVDVTHFEVVSSTTVAPPVTTVETSLFKEPIIVAESQEYSDSKPVLEKTEENSEDFATNARSSLLSNNMSTSSEQVLVTPRPVSSKFLAPITAGVQLQHIEEPIFEDAGAVEQKNQEQKGKVLVQVQKTIPYYLGMYQYPTADGAQNAKENMTENAVENIELGQSLLYVPEQQEGIRSQDIPEVTSNYLVGQQTRHSLSEAHQEQLTIQNQSKISDQQQQQSDGREITKVVHHPYPVPYPVVQKVPHPQPYPVETIVDRPVHIPVEVTKYVDRPYPVEVPVPYPQPYPVEKVVQKIVKEPYPVPVHIELPVPVERIVERKVHVPYFVEKPVGKEESHHKVNNRPGQVNVQQATHNVPQGYLLQIPGLFSQQKYSSLVPSYQPQKIQVQYYVNQNQKKNSASGQLLVHQNSNPYSYAPQISQYLSPKQQIRSQTGQKLKKLNLLVFPRVQVPMNLPSITKNPFDAQQSQTYHSFRHSNAQLDNGYLPPSPSHRDCQPNDQQTSAGSSNSFNVEHPGLIPPKRPSKDEIRNHRNGRSNFDDKSVRLEYGFMPPLIPSLEIDEHGQPIEKDDNKN